MREGESLDERLRKELLRSELKERNKGKRLSDVNTDPSILTVQKESVYV
ncbi:hypothetical protein [Agathobacter rectalis]|jgi:hypothetical protein|nr:hypothetical protein [Agathobacter rectalis]